MLSFNFILTVNPHNISKARPKDEIVKIGLYISPAIKPAAPKNSRTIVNKPSFSKPNRLNSFFIPEDVKYEMT